jgi:hypothetical protein
VSEKYAFIAAERAEANATAVANAPTIVQMCAWLALSIHRDLDVGRVLTEKSAPDLGR